MAKTMLATMVSQCEADCDELIAQCGVKGHAMKASADGKTSFGDLAGFFANLKILIQFFKDNQDMIASIKVLIEQFKLWFAKSVEPVRPTSPTV